MSIHWITEILQWLVPVGSAGTLLGWIFFRDLRKARHAKEKNDIYKEMYDNIRETLIELQNENKRLYRAVRQLNTTIQKATGCVHYHDCPLRDELQKSEGTDTGDHRRQPARRKKNRSDADAGAPGLYAAGGSASKAGGAACGGGL